MLVCRVKGDVGSAGRDHVSGVDATGLQHPNRLAATVVCKYVFICSLSAYVLICSLCACIYLFFVSGLQNDTFSTNFGVGNAPTEPT